MLSEPSPSREDKYRTPHVHEELGTVRIAKSKQDGGCRDLGHGNGERVFGRRGLRAEASDVLLPSRQRDRPHTDSVRPLSEVGPGASREVFLQRKATQVSTSWEPVKESGCVKCGVVLQTLQMSARGRGGRAGRTREGTCETVPCTFVGMTDGGRRVCTRSVVGVIFLPSHVYFQ